MDDMTTFEQRLAGEIERIAGPRRRVDARLIRLTAQARTTDRPWTALAKRFSAMIPGPDPATIPAALGHLPVQTGRTSTMFSASRLFAAAFILALTGGFLYSGVLTTQPDEQLPGAEADLWTGEYLEQADFVAVSGEASFGAGPGVVTGSSTMSDPRVSGDYIVGYQWLCAPDESCTTWGRVVLSNDGGTWEGDFVGINGPTPTHEENLMVWLNGTGDYEGWSYVANFTGPMSSTTGNGLLVAAPLPPQAALSFPETPEE